MWSSNSFQPNISPSFIPSQEGEQKQGFSQLYQTPIKQPAIIQNYNMTSSPFQFDFNFYFGNLFSSGHLPVPHFESLPSSSQPKREKNFLLFKSSLERSGFKINPGSEYKISNNITKSNISTANRQNEENPSSNNDNNFKHIFTKKNLCEVFNNAKNENFSLTLLDSSKKIKQKTNTTETKNSVAKEFLFGSPPQRNKNKKIFECSGSTMFNSTSVKSSQKKKRRFRKNHEQLQRLNVFYNENKHWSKNQIKKISEETGLKENKVYKWLWDQKNKEYKNAKFIVNK